MNTNTDFDQLDEPLFQISKTEHQLRGGLVESVFLLGTECDGNIFILPKVNSDPILIRNRPSGAQLYICTMNSDHLDCPIPLVLLPKYFSGIITIQTATKYPGRPVFTKAFSGPNIPVVLMSSVNGIKVSNSTNILDWVLSLSVSTDNFSGFLRSSTSSIPGSIGFILENGSNMTVIATNNQPLNYTGIFTATIKTIHDMDDGILEVYNQIIQKNPNFMNVPCNTIISFNNAQRRNSVYRLCTTTKIDWVIVFSVPQWNSLGSMIIAIVCALIGNVIILAFGSGLGMYSSFRITHPFYNLISLFEMVSNMELDSLHVEASKFKEVSQLQSHFLAMAKRIKEYRSFIPAHLLTSIDGGNESKDQEPHKAKVYNLVTSDSRRSLTSSAPSSSMASSFRADHNMFKLGLVNKDITFMRLYVENLNDLFNNLKDVSSTLTEVFTIIQNWADHPKKAADQTRLLIEKLNNVKKRVGSINFRFSMLTEKCSCGNVGTEKMRNYAIFGNYSENLDRMIQQTIKLNIPCLVSDSVFKVNSQLFEFRFICEKDLIKDMDSFFSLSDKVKKQKCSMYEMGNQLKVNMDEWMYELEEMEKKKKGWALYNRAIDFISKEEYEQALASLQDHLANHTEDKPTMKMIKKCMKKLKQ